MTEGVLVFIKEYMPEIAGAGFGMGFVLSCISCIAGYVISRVQGLFDNH